MYIKLSQYDTFNYKLATLATPSQTKEYLRKMLMRDPQFVNYMKPDEQETLLNSAIESIRQLVNTGKAGPIVAYSPLSRYKWKVIKSLYGDMTGKQLIEQNEPSGAFLIAR